MTTTMKSHSASEVLAQIRRDGVALVQGLISPEVVKAIRKEADWFLAEKKPWFKIDRQGPELYASVAPLAVPKEQLNRLEHTRAVFSEPFFRDVCNEYLDCDAVVDRIIYSQSRPSDRPITLWHADQQAEGRLSLKFMLYLTKTTADNGAFSYVPGSHAIVHGLMRKAAAAGIPNIDLQSFDQIAEACRRYGGSEEQAWLDKVSAHITGDFRSDDHFSLEADEGAILFFDTKGLHRGGVIRNGERTLVRIHCFEPELRNGPFAWGWGALDKVRSMYQPKPFGWG